MHPAAVWILLTLSSTAYRQPYSSEPGVRRYVAVSNEVGYRLQRALSHQEGNQLVSPYGISKLLSVLYKGSTGHTQQQIGRLGYRALEQQGVDISETYQQLHRYLQTGYGGSQFEEATAMLYPIGYSVSPQYQEILESSYQCLVQQVDYHEGSEGAIQGVNRWVQEQTRGRISQISDVDASSGIQLLNGVYYQGSLQSQSGEEQVQQLPFYNEGETSPQPVLYYQSQSRYPYYQDQQLQAVKLPYQDGEYSLLVVLPTQQDDIRQLQQQVSTGTIQYILRKSQRTQVRVSVPLFSLDYSRQLEQDFQSLGVTSIFEAAADFSGISSSSKSYVSQIAQRAIVQLGGRKYGQKYQYGAGQGKYNYQQYQPTSSHNQYEDEEGQYGGRYGTGEDGQYQNQHYQYEAGQGQYEGQYRPQAQQEYGYGIGQGQYEDQRQYQYRRGRYGRYGAEQDHYGHREQGHYGSMQGDEYGGEHYGYGIDQMGQYSSRYQYGDQQEYEYGLSGQSGVAEFKANRPFLFYVIHEPTGLNVLAGRISQL